jgi:hypothetical protein
MIGERHKLHSPTLGIMTTPEGKRIPVTVPKNAIVTVKAGPLDGTRLIDVEWDGELIMMFTVDLRERGERINGVGH